MWPDGVPKPATLKFYRLRPASQSIDRLSTDGSPFSLIPRRPFYFASFGGMENVNREFPYVNSGGMDWAAPGTWRNVTGLALSGSIKVWEGKQTVVPSGGQPQQENAVFWEFPQGTKAFDVLVRKNRDGSEHIFTIRVREKSAGKWSDGVSFFPDVAAGIESTYKTTGSRRTREALGSPLVSYRVADVEPIPSGKVAFKESRSTIEDGGHFFPPGFKGTGLSCNKCHVTSMASEKSPYSGPMLRGRDTVFSWHPMLESTVATSKDPRLVRDPKLDRRWPIQVVGNLR